MFIILLGAPGAGKGTQAAMVSQEFSLAHVASGDLFRSLREQDTELGLLVKSFYDRGELVPDSVAIRAILERISRNDCTMGCLLDGFPRTIGQARALDEALGKIGKSVGEVFYIKVSPEELLRRLGGRWICRRCQAVYHEVSSPPKEPGRCDICGGELYQRPDDAKETVLNRLNVYFSETAPLVEYYSQVGKLIEINGERTIESVGKDILSVLRNNHGRERDNN